MLRYGPVQVECMSCSMECDVISRLFRVCNLTRVGSQNHTTFLLLFIYCFILPLFIQVNLIESISYKVSFSRQLVLNSHTKIQHVKTHYSH